MAVNLGTGTMTTRKRRARSRARTIAGVRTGAATGIGGAPGSVPGVSFNAMHKAAGHDLANLVYGFSLGRGITPKSAVTYLNTIAENW